MDPGGKIYTIDEFRCWKVENLDDEVSAEYSILLCLRMRGIIKIFTNYKMPKLR
jgi:hypothetical protein